MSFAVLVLILCVGFGSVQQSNCSIEQAEPRGILHTDISLTPLWAKSFYVSSETTNSIVIADGMLIVPSPCGSLSAFDLSTGELHWHLTNLHNPKNLVLDIERQSIYISEPSALRAISTSSGETLWINNSSLFSHTANPSYLLSNGELVVNAVGRGIYEINPETGAIGRQISIPLDTILYTDQLTLVKLPTALQAVDNQTGNVVWSYDNLVGSWEILSFPQDRMILLRQRYSEITPKLIALDWNTGDLKWEFQNDTSIASIASSNSNLYTLDDKGKLQITDTQTGNVLGTAQFEFDYNSAENTDTPNSNQIRVENNTIVVYLEDEELLAIYLLDSPANS